MNPGAIPPLTLLPDGTLKQVNPFSGTEVWTTPNANRAVDHAELDSEPLEPKDFEHSCHFCSGEIFEATPEKARLVVDGDDNYRVLRGLKPSELTDTVPEFRRMANLFEILPYSYWSINYGYRMSPATAMAMSDYLSEEKGRKHVAKMLRRRLRDSGTPEKELKSMFSDENQDATLARLAPAFFSGGHDVIVAPEHYQKGATHSDQLASSGTMTYKQHRRFMEFTVQTMLDLYQGNKRAKYVVVFQNWLRAAGAQTNHVHKQLVAIDEPGFQIYREIEQVREYPNMYNDWATNYAAEHDLIIAQNEHAVMFAGFGHHYPTLEIFSTSPYTEPWQMPQEHLNAVSDLLHAAHVISGPQTAVNEEWYYRPLHSETPMPWRIMLKNRNSTMAGFESGTKIFLNTISPQLLKKQSIEVLQNKRDHIAPDIRIGELTTVEKDILQYNTPTPETTH